METPGDDLGDWISSIRREPKEARGVEKLDWYRDLKSPRKEVIQPHLPVRLPCYDFTPITKPRLDGSLLTVGPPASSVPRFRGVTGGVYKARERIHGSVLICHY